MLTCASILPPETYQMLDTSAQRQSADSISLPKHHHLKSVISPYAIQQTDSDLDDFAEKLEQERLFTDENPI